MESRSDPAEARELGTKTIKFIEPKEKINHSLVRNSKFSVLLNQFFTLWHYKAFLVIFYFFLHDFSPKSVRLGALL